jgi:hypothetical protein
MKTSTKLLVASALLLGGTSATLAQGVTYARGFGPSVNDAVINGGGSVGSNRNLNSALQNSRAYNNPQTRLPWTRSERIAYRVWQTTQTSDPLKLGTRGKCDHCAEGED